MARKKKVVPFAGKETPEEEAAEHKVLASRVRTTKRKMRGRQHRR
jgi:hypothetical protein